MLSNLIKVCIKYRDYTGTLLESGPDIKNRQSDSGDISRFEIADEYFIEVTIPTQLYPLKRASISKL